MRVAKNNHSCKQAKFVTHLYRLGIGLHLPPRPDLRLDWIRRELYGIRECKVARLDYRVCRFK
jgi:hypothetical protein